MAETSLENSSTVDEIVDSLVKEIDNELIHTLEDATKSDKDVKKVYQIPLQDIGEETMDMIVTYNTRVNSGLSKNSFSSLDEDLDIKENNNDAIENEDKQYKVNPQGVTKNSYLPEMQNSSCIDSDMDISGVEFSPLKRNDFISPKDSHASSLQQQINEVEQDDKTIPKVKNNLELSKSGPFCGIGILNLPPLPEAKPMFRNSSLAKILDNSIDSNTQEVPQDIDIKPTNFLSVWHLQEKENIGTSIISPALSSNSQFTRYTSSTMVSTPPMTVSPQNTATFKFKPRIVSQSKIYYPRSKTNSRISSGCYSMMSSDSVGQRDNQVNTIINSPIGNEYSTEKQRLSSSFSIPSEGDSASSNFNLNIETDLGIDLDFNDILNKLDHLGEDSLIKDLMMVSDQEDDPEVIQQPIDQTAALVKEVTPESSILVERNHIPSPFKVKSQINKKFIEEASMFSTKQEDPIVSDENIKTEHVEELRIVPLKDDGIIFLKINNLKHFKIDGAKRRNAQFSLNVKQGNKLLFTTKWNPVKNEETVPIMQDFSFRLDEEFQSFENNKLQFIVKLKYDRITKETIEVVKKIPQGKKFLFGKTKYVYETMFVDRPVDRDPWSNVIDTQGRFAACDIILDEMLLKESRFNKIERELKLNHRFSNISIAPSTLIQLHIELLYVARSSNDETIPEQLNKVDKIVGKYNYQKKLHLEGYLLQEGADVLSGSIQRRYFELNGSTLVASHELTKNPIITINLLNVEKITSSYDEDKGQEQSERKFTNLTDIILFGEHISLHFFDGEIVTFTPDTNDGSIREWYRTLQEVIALNASHQPWVKLMCKQ